MVSVKQRVIGRVLEVWDAKIDLKGLLVADARADRLAISARFKVVSWFVAFSADPSKHGKAHRHQSIHARTTISFVW